MTTVITGRVAGDDLDIQRDVTDVNVTDPLTKAWLTIKTSTSEVDPGVLQKVITSAAVPGTGQITEDGSLNQGNGTATLIFQLTAANTLALGVSKYYYDIQVKTSTGKIYTAERGTIQFQPGYTDATT